MTSIPIATSVTEDTVKVSGNLRDYLDRWNAEYDAYAEANPMTREDVLALLDEGQFRCWLESYPLNRVVGYCAMPSRCPLYEYLTDYGLSGVVVSGHMVDWDVPVHCYDTAPLPGWARQFIRQIDQHSTPSFSLHPALTVADCLRALEFVDGAVAA